MSEEVFGQVLRRLRGRRPLAAVARAAGISTSYVHKLENGYGTPTLTVVMALDAATNAAGELIAAYENLEPLTAKNVELRLWIACRPSTGRRWSNRPGGWCCRRCRWSSGGGRQ